MKFFRHRGAADDIAALDDLHLQSRLGQIGRAGEAVVTGAENQHIVIGCVSHVLHSFVSAVSKNRCGSASCRSMPLVVHSAARQTRRQFFFPDNA